MKKNKISIQNQNEAFRYGMRNNFHFFSMWAFKHVHGYDAILGPHISMMTHLVQEFNEDRAGNAIILNMAPRYLKSFICTVCHAAWAIGKNPNMQIMIITYGDDLTKDIMSKIRSIIESDVFKYCFPNTYFQKITETEVKTSKLGAIRGKSMHSSITGIGADLIIMDDPIKAQDALSKPIREKVNEKFDSSIYSRLNSKKDSKIFLVMQRVHQDDLAGYLLEKNLDNLFHIPIPAISDTKYPVSFYDREIMLPKGPLCSDREDEKTLEKIRNTIGDYNYAAQYLQNPIPMDGNIFKKAWLKYENLSDLDLRKGFTISSIDTASSTSETADYTVMTKWHFYHEKKYLLDIRRFKLEYSDLVPEVEKIVSNSKVNITVVEDANIGIALGSHLKQKGLNATKVKPLNSKEARAVIASPHFQRGEVIISKHMKGLDWFEEELSGFPNSKHDDVVDSISQALYYRDHALIHRWVFPEDYI